ncbi:short-chain dehydrogenase, partial [Acetobacter tropicalis]
GKQLGNPAKLAATVLQLVASDMPPPQLLLGSDALRLVRDRLSRMEREIEGWEELTLSTDG